ncbi:MAG TPA: cysteine desulfurase [Candidatus Moranbacteria bacterium]|nr:cysteine desulfurase [Candidatus Moranbacteria bacterium]
MDNKKIYLDYVATTPVDRKVFEKMTPYFSEKFGNPSSVHTLGQEAMSAVDKARENVANFLRSKNSEVVFTSGATESNNFAIKGIVRKYYADFGQEAPKPHIITSAFEHHSVLHTCEELKKEGLIELDLLPVKENGIVDVEKLKSLIRDNTLLISIMYVNNEIGTIQPIAEIGEMIANQNELRASDKLKKIFFHTDAVQAINYLNCDVEYLGVDLLSFSGHKIYGPKGVGVLFVKKGTRIKRIQDGGEQEYKMRAGTYNVPSIVGLGEAIKNIGNSEYLQRNKKIKELRDYLIDRILKEIPNSYLNGDKEKRTPNNANFRFDNIEGEGLLLSLDMEGIFASTGSACSSGSLDPSHVLLALGLKHEQAHGSLRLTLGKNTTKEEIDFTVEKIKEIVERLRKISGNVLKDFE